MQLKSHARTLAIALSLAVVAGCSSTGGSQDGDMDGGLAGGDRGGVTTGTTDGRGVNGDRAGQMTDADGRIPATRTIYFEYDSDTIRSEFEPVLTAHARFLRANPSATVILQGHTDERGTREYNLALGERRAGSVERYLNVQGVSPSQVEVVSYGEERPAARGANEQAYAQNRRVVFAY
ncbi:peptidoglycan-associated lipoprotein Pal [Halomonas saccharevitans]|uniref:Peptidoglycan-associated lipoprotein n=1 Tax=Halomonas saccharevitans TaxID=416872 RepID=A0ABU3NAB8_9GAMM|nr:peptidoglycan-associated lipoprotein Pal [Halomonas saccharevitans]MDT8878151.1 peptidoglycan-associated lipoprotein Pal [Halomonas saccharevitans]